MKHPWKGLSGSMGGVSEDRPSWPLSFFIGGFSGHDSCKGRCDLLESGEGGGGVKQKPNLPALMVYLFQPPGETTLQTLMLSLPPSASEKS